MLEKANLTFMSQSALTKKPNPIVDTFVMIAADFCSFGLVEQSEFCSPAEASYTTDDWICWLIMV